MSSEMQAINNPMFWAQCPEGFKLRVKHVTTYWDTTVGAWTSVFSHQEPDTVLYSREIMYITFSKPDEGQLKILLELAVYAYWLMTEPPGAQWPIGRT